MPYGEIKKVKILLKNYCAFVTFIDRHSAENAMNSLFNKFTIKGEKFKLQWGRSSKTNFEEEEHENKNNIKDISYKTECPINDPLDKDNSVLTKVEGKNNVNNIRNNNRNFSNQGKNTENIYNINLNNFEKGKKPYYPSMDPNLMGGEIKSRKNMKKTMNKIEGNESQKNFEKMMNFYADADD